MFYRIGNLVIRSPLSIRRPKPGEDCLVLKTLDSFPPAHPSTRAALTVLDRLAIKNSAKILDIGCGSGILGLVAALRTGGDILGCDISSSAIRASRQNAAVNRMEKRLHLFRGSADAVSGSFDLILANLQTAVHLEMLDHYRRLASQNDGLLIVSGFYDVQSADMRKALVKRGFVVLEEVQVHAWAAAVPPDGSFTWVAMGLKSVGGGAM